MRRLILIALLLFIPSAHADVLDEAWQLGTRAQLAGDYHTALTAYQQLDAQHVVSADLYYNMGISYFRKGDLGRAIWSFERALVVDPDDEDAHFNLIQTRKMTEAAAHDKLEGATTEPMWVRLVTFWGPSTQTFLFLGFYLGMFTLLFVRRKIQSPVRLAVTTGVAILGTFALISGLLLLGRGHLNRIPNAIILPPSVEVKEGANDSYRTSFKAHAGLRVSILGQEQDFVRVRLANGLEGFVRETTVGRL